MKEFYIAILEQYSLDNLSFTNMQKLKNHITLNIYHEKNNKFDPKGAALYLTMNFNNNKFKNHRLYNLPIDIGYIPRVSKVNTKINQFNYDLLQLLQKNILSKNDFFIHSIELIKFNEKEKQNSKKHFTFNNINDITDKDTFCIVNNV